MIFEIESTIQFVVRVDHYSPARQAPVCQNSSSPAFSDPGDPEEIEFTLFVKNKNELVEISDAVIYNILADEIFSEIRRGYEQLDNF